MCVARTVELSDNIGVLWRFDSILMNDKASITDSTPSNDPTSRPSPHSYPVRDNNINIYIIDCKTS